MTSRNNVNKWANVVSGVECLEKKKDEKLMYDSGEGFSWLVCLLIQFF